MAVYLGYDRVGILKYVKIPVKVNIMILTGTYTVTLNNVFGKEVNEFAIIGNSIQNGTPSHDNPIEVESVGIRTINMYDGELTTSMVTADGVVDIATASTKYVGLEYPLFLEGGGTYTIVTVGLPDSVIRNMYYGEWDVDGNFLGRLSTTNKSITLNSATNKFFLYFYISSGYDLTGNEKIMIVKGTSVLEYIPPYKIPINVDGKTVDIYLNKPLRKIGDYADTLDYKTKTVTRRIKDMYISDEKLRWSLLSSSDGVYRFEAPTSLDYMGEDAKLFISGKANGILCECYPTATYGSNTPNSISERTNLNYIKIMTDRYSNKNDFIQGLGSFKIYYILETPKVEQIEIPKIILKDGTNVITIETKVEPSETKITYLEEIIDG